MTRPFTPTDADLLQARLAARLAAGLGERAATLTPDVSERLRFARERAVARAAEVRRPQVAPVVLGYRGTVALGGATPWWIRLATIVPLLLLVAGLVGVEQLTLREQVLAAAEIDALLLADDVPPDAYGDPGFLEFLKTSPSGDAL